MTYTPSMVRRLLSGYQRRAQGARQRQREDVLVQRASPLEEAPWAASSVVWCDLEEAMQNLPFNWQAMVWEVVCVGESSARNGTKRYDWRRRWADWWGITPGDVNKIVSNAIEEMCDSLNGTLGYEREAETTNEQDFKRSELEFDNSLSRAVDLI